MTTIAVVCPRRGTSRDADHDAVFEQDAVFEKMVRAVAGAIPLVHVRSADTILMLARGAARFHGSLEAATAHLHAVCREALPAGAATASFGIGAAGGQFAAMVAGHASVRSGTPEIVTAEQTADFVGALSVRWLAIDDRIDPDHIGVLERLGLADLAAVRDLGERAMSDRFGAEGARMHRLAAGGDPEPLVAGAVQGAVGATWRRQPDDPGTGGVQGVVEAARAACERVFSELESRNLQCTAVRITVTGEGAADSDRIWHEPHGLSVRSVLARLARQITPPSGVVAVVAEVAFEAAGVRPVSSVQAHLWSSRSPETERAVRALSMVREIDIGARVAVPRLCGARDVLEMYRLDDASQVDLADESAAVARVRAGERWPGALPSPFPATLWSEALPAEVLAPDGGPVGVTGRHELTAAPVVLVLGDARHEILDHAGPWPLEERWWDARRRRRTARLQLLVRDGDGESVHLVHLENGRWRAVARYD